MGSKSLQARIAFRYLFGRKSHSAVNAIAVVSLIGVAVATAAIVCVLSVFNGFQEVLDTKLDALSPDIEISPADGAVFGNADALSAKVAKSEGVRVARPEMRVQALALLDGHELPVNLRGVDVVSFRGTSRLDSVSYAGSEPLSRPRSEMDAVPAAVSIGVASQLGMRVLGEQVTLFAPRRVGRINMANPAASFRVDSIRTSAIYQSGQKEFDENMIITDIDRVRRLLQYEAGDATSISVSLTPGASPGQVMAELEKVCGAGFRVRDRAMQHEVNFRMIRIEKYITFLLLVFILVIASFNIVSTLCMLVIEKEGTLKTLDALGMSRARIGRIFGWESWLVSLAGGIGGILLGACLCLVQEKFGLIKLNGDAEMLQVLSYPVALEWGDLLLAMAPIVVIGALTALTASRFARRAIG